MGRTASVPCPLEYGALVIRPWVPVVYRPWVPVVYRLWAPVVYRLWALVVYRLWVPVVYRLWAPVVYRLWAPVVYRDALACWDGDKFEEVECDVMLVGDTFDDGVVRDVAPEAKGKGRSGRHTTSHIYILPVCKLLAGATLVAKHSAKERKQSACCEDTCPASYSSPLHRIDTSNHSIITVRSKRIAYVAVFS